MSKNKPVEKWLLLVLFYGTFVISAGLYLRKVIRYWGVGNWPSIDAKYIEQTGEIRSFPSQGPFGAPTSTTLDNRSVHFEYVVNGITHHGANLSPDGGGISGGDPTAYPWRAYYKPSSPDIAVLNPVPYQGTGLMVTAIASGILVVGHLYFALVEWIDRIRCRRARSPHPPSARH